MRCRLYDTVFSNVYYPAQHEVMVKKTNFHKEFERIFDQLPSHFKKCLETLMKTNNRKGAR